MSDSNSNRIGFLNELRKITTKIQKISGKIDFYISELLNLDENKIDETIYWRKPNGINEYAKVLFDRGHEDVADRIFKEQGYDKVLQEVKRKTGIELTRLKFLCYAGYILVDAPGIKIIPCRKGQNDIPQLIYCSYALSDDNLEFVESKKSEFKNYAPIISDWYGETGITDKRRAEIRNIVDIVKSEIEKAEKVKEESIQNTDNSR